VFARIVGRRVAVVSATGEKRLVEPEEIHLPPGERGFLGIAPTALLWLDDGTLIAGAGDGAVTALDGEGKRRSSLGFRGAITGLASAGEGAFVVTTASGMMALVTGDGRLRWERAVTAEPLGPAAVTRNGTILAASARGVFALSAAGEPVFSHGVRGALETAPPVAVEGDEIVVGAVRFRMDAPHPAIPSREPIFSLGFERVATGRFSAVIALGPNEIVALGDYPRTEYNDWPSKPTQQLVRVVDGKITRTILPHQTAGKEPFQTARLPKYYQQSYMSVPSQKDPLVSDAMIVGPEGNPWILGRRLSASLTGGESGYTGRWVGAGVILEPDSKGAHERRDLHEALDAHPSVGDEGMIAAAPHGRASLLCFGAEDAACALYDGSSKKPALLAPPAPVLSVARIGDDDWLVTKSGAIHRRKGRDFVEVPGPEIDAPPLTAIAGTSERDLWAAPKEGWAVAHFDGSAWREVPVPRSPAGGLFVRAVDDVWAMHGRARWDGQRWSLVYGAPDAKAVLARTHDDVWLAGEGLWHATTPGPAPVRLAAPPPDPGVAPAAVPAPMGPPDKGFSVSRMSFSLAREAPLAAARRVIAREGVMWFADWDRLVETSSSGDATTLRRGTFGFARAMLPEGAGRGLVLERSAVQRFTSPKTTEVLGALDQRDLVALDAGARGTLWAVGDSDVESRWPSALVRDGASGRFQPVVGLPAAAWIDVAAAPDGGAWFAGGLSPGPTGEGILFHARGPSGRDGTARYRAPASLLAVAASSDEAWAVGAAGVVVRVRGASITRWTLPSGEWLRAVAIAGPREVWIGGDGGTLLRFDGEVFHPVPHPLGANASVTSIALPGGGLVWAVGPSGIVRIARRG
jgi:hypothetical protein